MKLHAVLFLFAVISAACAAEDNRRRDSKPARIVLLSDTHIFGPQNRLNDEPNAVDNESVLKTQQRLWQAYYRINKIKPRPDLALITGDFIHDGMYTHDWDELVAGPANSYSVAQGINVELNMPLAIAYGNHDFKVKCDKRHPKTPRHLTERLYRHYFGIKPYSSVDLGSWKLLVMNSEQGRTWHAGHEGCDTRLSSYGKEQLQWAAEQLAEGLPTIVAMHHPLPTSATNEEPDLRWPDIVSLLSAHDNVKLVLSGHYHKGYDWGDLYPFVHRTLPALRYTAENYFLLDLYPNGTFSMPDWEKNKGGSRCSHTWHYKHVVEPDEEGDGEPGDCGVPLANETALYQLPHIDSEADIPPEFNPERSCAYSLAEQLLAPCLRHEMDPDHPSEGCCSILTTQFQHGSDRPFDGCLCQPAFWQNVETTFSAYGFDATTVIEGCVRAADDALVFYRGAGACPAPSDSSRRHATGRGWPLGEAAGSQVRLASTE